MAKMRAMVVVSCVLGALLSGVAPAAAQQDEWRTSPDIIWDVTSPDPNSRHTGPVRALVRDMQEHNGRMYVAGKFLELKAPDGSTRDQPYLAAFDLETGE